MRNSVLSLELTTYIQQRGGAVLACTVRTRKVQTSGSLGLLSSQSLQTVISRPMRDPASNIMVDSIWETISEIILTSTHMGTHLYKHHPQSYTTHTHQGRRKEIEISVSFHCLPLPYLQPSFLGPYIRLVGPPRPAFGELYHDPGAAVRASPRSVRC